MFLIDKHAQLLRGLEDHQADFLSSQSLRFKKI